MKKHTIYLLAISITEEMEGWMEMEGWRRWMDGGRDGWMAGGVKQRVLTVVLMTIP